VVGQSYERLSAQDISFLVFEHERTHVHVSAVAIFEAGPLWRPGGGLDMARIRSYVEGRLGLLPRYRRRLDYTPVQRHPIWVDDERFDPSWHVRHAALPFPGGDAELKDLAGRIASQPLDRTRPLWELWFVEGLSGDRLAVIAKVHHCLVDGVSGVDLLRVLLSPSPTLPPVPVEAAPPPTAPPGALTFLADGAARGVQATASIARGLGDAVTSPRRTAEGAVRLLSSGWQTVRAGISAPPRTPLNGPTGTQRRVDWVALDLDEVRDLKKRLDGSVNDVVLGVVAGATRSFLRARRAKLKGVDLRVVVPVDTRAGEGDRHVANRVSAWFVKIPMGERDPVRRFQRIRAQTRGLKEARAHEAIDRFMRLADWSGSTLMAAWGARFVRAIQPYNLVVSNVPGPRLPLYLLGAQLLEFYPQLPLFENQGLSVTALSYGERIGVGLIGDRDLLPDLERFSAAVSESFEELRAAAEKRA